MSDSTSLPRLLIIDDLFGRTLADRRNEQRANLCGQYLIEDVTGDEVGKGSAQRIKRPVAQAVFFRGQTPATATVGDTVENDLAGTLETIRKGWFGSPDGRDLWSLVLLDLCFRTGPVTAKSDRDVPGMADGRKGDDDPGHYFGLQILRAIHDEFPDLPVVILSSQPREEVSREFTRLGASAFLARTNADSPDLLRDYLRRYGLIPDDGDELIGRSKALLLALRAARVAASHRLNVLIRGERGAGKELLARYIHRQRGAPNAPFIEVNAGTMKPELYDSVLFGHEKGSFTGATERRQGKLYQANGGDLFLDEIKDMLPQVQAGVLKVLEDDEYMPVGGTAQKMDVRFLSATNADIEAMAATGEFRPDLLDRLCEESKPIVLPPLRKRIEDIHLLVEKFVRNAEEKKPGALSREVDSEALETLCRYDWPGNVRELRDCIFGAVNHHPDVEHLMPIHIRLPQPQSRGASESVPIPIQVPAGAARNLQFSGIKELIRLLDDFSFDVIKPGELAGRLPDIQGSFARTLARYVKAALEATRRPTPENPEGEILIHPAMKLLTGDSKLTASQAADLIKRLLAIDPSAVEDLVADPILKEAHENALRLRPRRPKASRNA